MVPTYEDTYEDAYDRENQFRGIPENGWVVPGVVTVQEKLPAGAAAPWWGIPEDVALWPALFWQTGLTPDRHVNRRDDGKGEILSGFLEVDDAESARKFAQRWGPLDLCRFHPFKPIEIEGLGHGTCRPMFPWEPLAVWLHLAERARATVAIAALLNNNQPAPAETWRVLLEGEDAAWLAFDERSNRNLWSLLDHPADAEMPVQPIVHLWEKVSEKAILTQWFHLTDELDRWQVAAEARPRLWYDGEAFKVTVGGRGLFGALSLELLLRVSGVGAIAFCTKCGRPYLPTRLTKGRQNYCGVCGKRAADNDSKQRQRAGTAKPRPRVKTG